MESSQQLVINRISGKDGSNGMETVEYHQCTAGSILF